ncbi:MAG: efflux transporter outer membrane subunit [Variovorax sp.]|nr:MAG: efflux transporter outer membrane subunit [Variovorax sp.]
MTRLLPEPIWRRPAAVAAAVMALALAGCADMTGINSQAKLRDAGSLGIASASPAPDSNAPAVDSRWWLAFGDPQLNALIDRALAGNPNLQIARARIARAQAVSDIVDAAGKPQISGSLDLMRQKFSSTSIYPAPLGGSVQEMGTLQIDASWELDFFGKNRTALDAAIGAANAAAADADAAHLLLASNVAHGYVQWARLQDRLAVAQRTLAQREETLKLVRDRVSAGLDTRLELKQSETGLPQARQQIESIREQIAITQHLLDALVAQPNATQALQPPALGSLKAIALQPTIPADLLGLRADIAAARWRVEAASGDVANAKTQFYPNINLVAFAGFSSIGFDRFFNSGSQQWGVGPAVRLPIFESGRLRANLRGKSADLDAAVDSYNATVLDAVREVADQVTSVQSVARQQAEQREAQSAAEDAYDIAVQRYGAGLGNYLNVLTAEEAVLLQRREAVDLAARALDAQVGLTRVIGGGWQPGVATAGMTAGTHP